MSEQDRPGSYGHALRRASAEHAAKTAKPLTKAERAEQARTEFDAAWADLKATWTKPTPKAWVGLVAAGVLGLGLIGHLIGDEPASGEGAVAAVSQADAAEAPAIDPAAVARQLEGDANTFAKKIDTNLAICERSAADVGAKAKTGDPYAIYEAAKEAEARCEYEASLIGAFVFSEAADEAQTGRAEEVRSTCSSAGYLLSRAFGGFAKAVDRGDMRPSTMNELVEKRYFAEASMAGCRLEAESFADAFAVKTTAVASGG